MNTSAEYLHSEFKGESYVRLNIMGPLGKGFGTYTFLELYPGGGYFGKSMYSKNNIWKGGLGFGGEFVHANHPFAQHGFGVTLQIPYVDKIPKIPKVGSLIKSVSLSTKLYPFSPLQKTEKE